MRRLSPSPLHLSEPARRRSRCGSVRGRPVLSSHFSLGFAPHVGIEPPRLVSVFTSWLHHALFAWTRWSISTSPEVSAFTLLCSRPPTSRTTRSLIRTAGRQPFAVPAGGEADDLVTVKIGLLSSPLARSQGQALSSSLAVKRRLPSALKAMARTGSVWPMKDSHFRPVSAYHRWAMRSSPPVTTHCPSADSATASMRKPVAAKNVPGLVGGGCPTGGRRCGHRSPRGCRRRTWPATRCFPCGPGRRPLRPRRRSPTGGRCLVRDGEPTAVGGQTAAWMRRVRSRTPAFRCLRSGPRRARPDPGRRPTMCSSPEDSEIDHRQGGAADHEIGPMRPLAGAPWFSGHRGAALPAAARPWAIGQVAADAQAQEQEATRVQRIRRKSGSPQNIRTTRPLARLLRRNVSEISYKTRNRTTSSA